MMSERFPRPPYPESPVPKPLHPRAPERIPDTPEEEDLPQKREKQPYAPPREPLPRDPSQG